MSIVYSNSNFHNSVKFTAALAIAAMDQGFRVVSYDSRFYFHRLKDLYSEEMASLERHALSMQLLRAEIAKSPENIEKLIGDRPRSVVKCVEWLLCETEWLTQQNPTYAPRLEAINTLVKCGHQKSMRVSSVATH